MKVLASDEQIITWYEQVFALFQYYVSDQYVCGKASFVFH